MGVYIGFDSPKTLGKYETGSKAALPIFKSFIKKALYKEEFKILTYQTEFIFTPINYDTGKKTSFADKKLVIEALKLKDINNLNNKNLNINTNYDKLIKFRQFY